MKTLSQSLNESLLLELDSTTYRNAAKKAAEYGQSRADKFKEWADLIDANKSKKVEDETKKEIEKIVIDKSEIVIKKKSGKVPYSYEYNEDEDRVSFCNTLSGEPIYNTRLHYRKDMILFGNTRYSDANIILDSEKVMVDGEKLIIEYNDEYIINIAYIKKEDSMRITAENGHSELVDFRFKNKKAAKQLAEAILIMNPNTKLTYQYLTA